MRNVKCQPIEGLSLLFEVITPIFELPCVVCNSPGGFAAVTQTGEDEEFAIPACAHCAKWSPVFKQRIIYYVLAA